MCQECDNVIFRLEEDLKERFLAFQARKKGNYDIQKGDHVKTDFQFDGKTEHMWVEVTNIVIEDTLVQGHIANKPFILGSPYKEGALVMISCNRISQHLRGEEEL